MTLSMVASPSTREEVDLRRKIILAYLRDKIKKYNPWIRGALWVAFLIKAVSFIIALAVVSFLTTKLLDLKNGIPVDNGVVVEDYEVIRLTIQKNTYAMETEATIYNMWLGSSKSVTQRGAEFGFALGTMVLYRTLYGLFFEEEKRDIKSVYQKLKPGARLRQTRSQ